MIKKEIINKRAYIKYKEEGHTPQMTYGEFMELVESDDNFHAFYVIWYNDANIEYMNEITDRINNGELRDGR